MNNHVIRIQTGSDEIFFTDRQVAKAIHEELMTALAWTAFEYFVESEGLQIGWRVIDRLRLVAETTAKELNNCELEVPPPSLAQDRLSDIP
jgi:hypothetical protein